MSEAELVVGHGDRGSVRLTKTAAGVVWSVTVALGATAEEVEAARVIAEAVGGRLARDVEAAEAAARAAKSKK